MQLVPAPGDQFSVPGRRELLTVAEHIASFTHEDAHRSLYMVTTADGTRWMLAQNLADDGPPWVGTPARIEGAS